MSASLHCPPTPCNTCPYRRDTPAGIWDSSEYEKLPLYDNQQPTLAIFHCHQENATGKPTVCKGWLSTHGYDALAVRLAVSLGQLTVAQIEAPCSVPLYESGAEACREGKKGIRSPDQKAHTAIRKLLAKGAAKI